MFMKITVMTQKNIMRLSAGKALSVFILVLLICGRSYGQYIAPQDIEKFQIMEDSMVVTIDSMYNALIPDTRIGYSERFVKQLVRTLKIPNSYYYSFNKIKDKINIISPDDNKFRMFNWEITPSNVLKRYYGAIQLPQEKLKLFGLNDYAEQTGKGAEDSILKGGKWFGGIIYRIIPVEYRGRTIYTMFGRNASNPMSNKKVLDPMMLDERGVTFGAPVFGIASTNFPRQRINRFVLEYKKDVQASMNWDAERSVIMFDKLVSQVNDPTRKYTYVPSGQYDGLRWDNETWNYIQDLIPVTMLKDGDAPSDPPPGNK